MGFTLCSPCRLGTLPAASHVHSMNPKFLSHRELLKEISPELKHIFVKFRLETGHWKVHRKLGKGITRFFNIGRTSEFRELVAMNADLSNVERWHADP